MGRNMLHGIRLNLPAPSPEEAKEQSDLLLKVWQEREESNALEARRKEPLASLILREHLLNNIKPPGLQ
jgi:hypothetical protein